MNSLALSRTTVARLLAVVALLVTVCSTLLVAQSGTAEAAPRRCFGWSGNNPYKGAGITIFGGLLRY